VIKKNAKNLPRRGKEEAGLQRRDGGPERPETKKERNLTYMIGRKTKNIRTRKKEKDCQGKVA